MKRTSVWVVSMLMFVSAVLTACGSSSTAVAPTSAAPAATSAPAPTSVAPAATTAVEATTAPAATMASEATSAPAMTAEATSAPAATAMMTAEATSAAASTATASGEPFTFGMVMVGTINDGGWNQAMYEGAKYAESKIPGSKFIYVDKVNVGDRPNVKVEQVIDDLVSQGAKFIITNSAEYKDGTNEAAKAHPDVTFVHTTGDAVLDGSAPPNVGNLMGRMEYGKMMAGCAAALQSDSGKISYLGPLIDPETRRLVNAAYLGAKYCWETYRGKPASDLKFNVTWIGFWFNIPGVTLDPTKVVNDFINAGTDVIISGIDTTEALTEADKSTKAGKKVYALQYDWSGACKSNPSVCLGVPYFNWGPSFAKSIQDVQAGTWKQSWDWIAPDWSNIDNPDTSIVGFTYGDALAADNKTKLQEFVKGLGDKSIDLYKGPLKYQDGKDFVVAGQNPDDKTIWYSEQLLQGIEGQSAAAK